MADQDRTTTQLPSALDRLEVRTPGLGNVIRALEAVALMSLAVAESERAAPDERVHCAHAFLELGSFLKRLRLDLGRPLVDDGALVDVLREDVINTAVTRWRSARVFEKPREGHSKDWYARLGRAEQMAFNGWRDFHLAVLSLLREVDR